MSSRSIQVATDADGNFSYERPCFAAVLGVKLTIGDLDTPDIVVDDANEETTFAAWTGATGDDFVQVTGEGVPYLCCSGTLRVTVTGAGADRHGTIRLLLWGS